MLPVELTEEAEKDLEEILDYYEAQSEGLGDRFLVQFDRLIQFVSANPGASPLLRDDIRWRHVRRFPYKAVFRVGSDVVYIIAVFHTRRDTTPLEDRIDDKQA